MSWVVNDCGYSVPQDNAHQPKEGTDMTIGEDKCFETFVLSIVSTLLVDGPNAPMYVKKLLEPPLNLY